MANLTIPFLKMLTAGPFQRKPRPKVNVLKLHKAIQRMGAPDAQLDDLLRTLQQLKGRGLANTTPKILLPDEIKVALFEIWITPLGRDALSEAVKSEAE